MRNLVLQISCICLHAAAVAQIHQATEIEFLDPTFGNNSDYTALYRDDVQSDQTILKLQLGDEHHGYFEGGFLDYSDNIWEKTFAFDGYGNGYFKTNLGIGVEVPSVRLEVNGKNFAQATTEKAVCLRMFNTYNVSGHYYKHSAVDFVVSRWEQGGDNRPETQLDIRLSGNADQTYDDHIPNLDIITLRSDGRVGIGTTFPDEQLTVKGSIHANEVRVDMNSPISGPDYVFEEHYKLLSLQDLEAYITDNKHLPQVPSAQQMYDEGLNLKAMNLTLLKKVEELTLYLINQQKDILKLQEENNALKLRITAIESK